MNPTQFFFLLLKSSPEFYEASIRQDRPVDSIPIIFVSATDADSGDAGTVEYELQGSPAVFSVGSSDGGIRLESSPASGKFNLTSSSRPL